jgi:hypothetical protein
VYEQIAQLQRKGTCTTEIIQRYHSEVIPLAQKSTFNVPKNKFLFLANRDVLALTELNYNACIFADGEPVTLKFADRVGEILTAGPIGTDTPPLPFQFYI